MRRIALLAVLLSGCAEEETLSDIRNEVAEDAVAQYRIVEQNGGTEMDKCVQAGLVTAAYLQAQNENRYRHWRVMEKLHCANAGLSR